MPRLAGCLIYATKSLVCLILPVCPEQARDLLVSEATDKQQYWDPSEKKKVLFRLTGSV